MFKRKHVKVHRLELLKSLIVMLCFVVGCIFFNCNIVNADTVNSDVTFNAKFTKLVFKNNDQGKKSKNITFRKIPKLKLRRSEFIQLSKFNKRLMQIKPTEGKINSFNFSISTLYKSTKNNKLRAVKTSKLRPGDKGKIALLVNLKGLKSDKSYSFVDLAWPTNQLIKNTDVANKKGKLPLKDYTVVLIPFKLM